MFFEGAEKKAEIQVDSQKLSLLNDIPNEYWHDLVHKCEAKILSSIENKYCKAFLLSESSLFVWDDRFLILTCGETKLINSIEFFIQTYDVVVLKQVTYQRKNEYFSHAQPSCFGDDLKILAKYLDGQAYRFGALDGHHNYIFHYENDFEADQQDKTYELLAYQISERASKLLSTEGLSKQQIRTLFNFDQLIPGFAIDDFVFEPYGYSLNAIKDDKYLTIHVTPQESSSYVSFESNIDLISLTPQIMQVLEPESFDILTYNEFDYVEKVNQFIPREYQATCKIQQTLTNGYEVKFSNYLKPSAEFTSPAKININGDNHAL
ncbi:adenosylmethionine decarboxylase [uncultured Psychrosphaera sp.]|uniref:adenosylmethionine decarboxylase n=1 Tax=uncultured Psychrosphaera sp. TaxID=1403522 RepID=UPI00261B037C|nr:adenosylmethionine decarboxylase [uncultured Psychrosphaera sp.]